MFSFLKKFKCDNAGIILNVDNSVIENNGKSIIITIPHQSFDKFGTTIINESFTTKHTLKNNKIVFGKSRVKFIKGKKGFTIEEVIIK
jgi:hypothetical protein